MGVLWERFWSLQSFVGVSDSSSQARDSKPQNLEARFYGRCDAEGIVP